MGAGTPVTGIPEPGNRADSRAEAEDLLAALIDAGAEQVEADILQPAGTLLDLYGEDIRARAYVTADPLEGEMMLRPDFTVPVVQQHMARGGGAAQYCYMGEVFRRQDAPGPGRAREYLQVGYEDLGHASPALADAEVFATIAGLLPGMGLRAVTGDIGILIAAVEGLQASGPRKAALRRHLWRPARFRALLERFAARVPAGQARLDLIARLGAASPEALIAGAGTLVGLRGADEIAARIGTLLADAAEPPVPEAEAAALDAVLAVAGDCVTALGALQALAGDLPSMAGAVSRLARRLDALDERGVDVGALAFEASHGRASMEYYDGFVFSLMAPAGDLPPVASGGRYDALTARLGQGRALPAVGGVIRPALVVALSAGAPGAGGPRGGPPSGGGRPGTGEGAAWG
jgi:ATP phosphoribosyltransferase regulatory subunit